MVVSVRLVLHNLTFRERDVHSMRRLAHDLFAAHDCRQADADDWDNVV